MNTTSWLVIGHTLPLRRRIGFFFWRIRKGFSSTPEVSIYASIVTSISKVALFNDNRTQARSFNLVYFLEWSSLKVFLFWANAGLSPNLHCEILCWKAWLYLCYFHSLYSSSRVSFVSSWESNGYAGRRTNSYNRESASVDRRKWLTNSEVRKRKDRGMITNLPAYWLF